MLPLAELVKNAYDADATQVTIRFGTDSISILDNGTGMGIDEFRKYWMRIGTTHKQAASGVALVQRAITGSKESAGYLRSSWGAA